MIVDGPATQRPEKPAILTDGRGNSADSQTNTTASRGPTDISSAATREALSLQVKALSRLHELAMRLASTSEPQPALQAILDTLVDVHNADFGLLSLYDPASGYLLANACVGFDAAALASVARIAPTSGVGLMRQRICL